MKTFGKKLFSLMLAVLMLAGAMPTAAFADEAEADVQADAGTPIVVENGTNTYDESGSDNNQVALQDDGNFKVTCTVIVHVVGGVNGDSADFYLVDENDKKEATFREKYDDSIYTDKQRQDVTKNTFNALKLKNASLYQIEQDTTNGMGTLDLSSRTFTIEVLYKSHDCQKYATATDDGDDDYHTIKCAVCGAVSQTKHTYKTTVKSELGHTLKCSACGHVSKSDHTKDFYKTIGTDAKKGDTFEDNGETVTVTAVATEASCTKKAKYAAVKYDCGYTVGGEEHGSLAEHEYNSKDVCVNCGHKKDGEKIYDVNIYLVRGTNTALLTGTAKLTDTDIKNLTTNAAGAKTVLSKTTANDDNEDEDKQKIINAYAKNMADYYSSMGRLGTSIDIYVTEDLSKTIDSENSEINVMVYGTLVTNTNGQLVEDENGVERTVTVGKSYFDQIKQTDPTGKRTLVSMKVTGASGTRTINKANSSSNLKVRSDDTDVQLIWSAKQVTVKFYRTVNSTDKNGLVATITLYAGEVIDTLPKIDGADVDWILENGKKLEEGGYIYDFNTDVIRAYPSSNSKTGVYLFVYKNGDTTAPVNNQPEDITNYAGSGVVNRDELTSVIEGVMNRKNLQITGLFDYDGWSNYVATKRVNVYSSVTVGKAADREAPTFLYVMVNANSGSSSSSSKADASNPKTGDTAMIGTAFAVMAVAAIGLGTATVVLKKKEDF